MKLLHYILLLLLLLPAGFVYSQQHTFIEGYDSSLISLDLSGCNHYVSCKLPDNLSIACTPDGRLWGIGIDTIGPILFQIDILTGQCTQMGHFAKGGNSLVALNDSILLTDNGDSLYAITTSNVHSYSIGYIGYTSLGDLTWYGNDLFMMAHDNSFSNSLLIKITLNSNYSAISHVAPVSNKPSLPNCVALATVFLPNSAGYSIVGFNGLDAYAINPTDGAYQLLCSSIIPDFAGLAEDAGSVSYPNSTILDSSSSYRSPKVYPNPASNYLYVDNYGNANAILTLADVTGRELLLQTITKGINQVDVSVLAEGVYMAIIRTSYNRIIVTKKIIIR